MTSDLGYSGKRVIVSGCYSGIGQATAQLLLEYGAEVHGLDLTPNDLALHSFTALDLRDPGSIDAAVRTIGGRVDALFNCAGVAPGRDPIDVLKVNFIGTRRLTDQVLPQMPRGGAIVNVSSNGGAGWNSRLATLLEFVETPSYDAAVAWCRDHPDLLAKSYSVSKEALIVWTMLAASRLIKQGVRMNCTAPGAVQTPMLEEIQRVTPAAAIDIVAQPIGRRSLAAEQAFPLVMLNSDAASYINGAVLAVDGGFSAARTTSPNVAHQDVGRR